ncbi:cytochrome P450 [Nostoc sp. CHAB 5715]|uniref:cytochrome P450 n=1 Tax=Nostoc sp. CHAB 5715 TaxID=2780400 RepID=UPI001E4D9E2A|nr:cytochrome P450 [Nostoc sp. CHAB 5715]MCC5625208.1 cytochrome P450 [Nostoc sp. CHAB 5715]
MTPYSYLSLQIGGLRSLMFWESPKTTGIFLREWAVETAKLFDGRQLTIKQAKSSQKCSFDLRAYLIQQIKKRYKNPKEDAISLWKQESLMFHGSRSLPLTF